MILRSKMCWRACVAAALQRRWAWRGSNAHSVDVMMVLQMRAGLRPGDALVDLYCGSGALALGLARECERAGFELGSITGVEAVASALRDGRANAQRNGIRKAM